MYGKNRILLILIFHMLEEEHIWERLQVSGRCRGFLLSLLLWNSHSMLLAVPICSPVKEEGRLAWRSYRSYQALRYDMSSRVGCFGYLLDLSTAMLKAMIKQNMSSHLRQHFSEVCNSILLWPFCDLFGLSKS